MLITNNEGAGFYGTALIAGNSTKFADKAWEKAFEKVISAIYAIGDAPHWPDRKIRDFLDSTCGRHYSDYLSGDAGRMESDLNQPKYLQQTCKRFSKAYDPELFD